MVGAMEAEMNMIHKNGTWKLVERPKGKNIIGVKWVFRVKYNSDGSINKYKARLVVKGYAQQPGVDYGETFAPVAQHDTIRLIIALAAHLGWKIFHLDVKSAFLNGDLEEEIYVNQPEGFIEEGKEDKVYLLKKALYGLKQAPRAWYNKGDSYLTRQGFRRSVNEATLYVKVGENSKQVILSLYVDDMLVTGNDPQMLQNFKIEMEKMFEMSDLGYMHYFLGMEIHQEHNGIFLSQRKYAQDILKKFKMDTCKAVSTPFTLNLKLLKNDGDRLSTPTSFRSLVGSLLYLTASRPDLMFPASMLSRYMTSPSEVHFGVAKRVLRYLKGTLDFGIWFESTGYLKLVGYCDSDWAGCVDDSKSTSSYVFSLGSEIFSWNSKKQEVVARRSYRNIL